MHERGCPSGHEGRDGPQADAMSDFSGLPVSDVKRVALRPDDVVVIETTGRLSQEQVRLVTDYAASVWPNNRCVVLDEAVRLTVVGEESAARTVYVVTGADYDDYTIYGVYSSRAAALASIVSRRWYTDRIDDVEYVVIDGRREFAIQTMLIGSGEVEEPQPTSSAEAEQRYRQSEAVERLRRAITGQTPNGGDAGSRSIAAQIEGCNVEPR